VIAATDLSRPPVAGKWPGRRSSRTWSTLSLGMIIISGRGRSAIDRSGPEVMIMAT
jgi:hypothetical protein